LDDLVMILLFLCPHPIYLPFVRVRGLVASGECLLLPRPAYTSIQFHPVLRAMAPLRLIAKFFLTACAFTDLISIIALCLVARVGFFLTCEKLLRRSS